MHTGTIDCGGHETVWLRALAKHKGSVILVTHNHLSNIEELLKDDIFPPIR